MKKLNIRETRTEIASVPAEIEEKGESFIIFRDGRPIAEFIPHKQKKRSHPHPVMSQIEINYDPTETLSRDEWPEED